MSPAAPEHSAPLAADRTVGRLEDFLALTKPRVVPLIVFTAAAGYYLGASGPLDLVRLIWALVGTALTAGGSLGINQWAERDLDARMARTQGRPIPAGRLRPPEALAACSVLTAAGLLVLGLGAGLLAALVAALTVASYLLLYTPLKRRSWLCTVVGAVPGALPPLIGWAAARGELGVGALALFLILFFWQLPHAYAVARLYRDQYAAAGIQVLPVVDEAGHRTSRQVVASAVALLGMGTLPTLIGLAGTAYLAVSLVAGGALLVASLLYARADTTAMARRLFVVSLAYVPLLFLAMGLDKVAP